MMLQIHDYAALRRAAEHYEREMGSLQNSDMPYSAMFPEGDAASLRKIEVCLKRLEARNKELEGIEKRYWEYVKLYVDMAEAYKKQKARVKELESRNKELEIDDD